VDVAEQHGIRYCRNPTGIWGLASRDKVKAAGLSSFYLFQRAGLPFIVFPYIKDGEPVFIKTRCLLSKHEAEERNVPRFLNTGGRVPCLWNNDAIPDADKVLICEGEIDALTAIMAGFVGVGLPGWSHWKDAWTPAFRGNDVVLMMDGDNAGQKGAHDIATSFIEAGLPTPRRSTLPSGMDLNDIHVANTPQ